MTEQVTPPSNESFIQLFLKVLLHIIQKLSAPIPLFVIAICILVLLAAAVGGVSLVSEIRILFGSLAIAGLVAILISQLLSHSRKITKLSRGGSMEPNSIERFQLLRKSMEVLTLVQFHDMISALLTPAEQDDLSQPLTKGSFLNDMNRWGRLDKVEQYLRQKFPDHFPD